MAREACTDKVDCFHFGTRAGESKPRMFWNTVYLDWRDLDAGLAGGTGKHTGEPVSLRWDEDAKHWRLITTED